MGLLIWFGVSLALMLIVTYALYRVSLSSKANVSYIAFALLLLGIALGSVCLSALFNLISLLL